MNINREIVVLGDIEMGGGTLTDDFISDKALGKLISGLSSKIHDIDLILNGDTFDFLKCPYIINNRVTYPRHITSEISLAKLRLMHQAHPKIFEELKRFLVTEGKRVFFIVGNHDADLAHKEVQNEIKNILGSNNVFFSFYFNQYGVYTEHGHQCDFLNKVSEDYLFLKYNGNSILNIPWVAFGLISKFMTMKEEHPFLERIRPVPMIFSHHKTVAKKFSRKTFEYVLKSAFYYPIRYYSDPTYTVPQDLFREFYRRVKNVHWDVDDIIGTFKKKRGKLIKESKVCVLGHVHKRYIEEVGDCAIIHPDAWRDEYFMYKKNRKLVPKTKRFVQILVLEDGSLQWELLDFPIKRTALHFDDIIRDEKKYLQLAAAEEGFSISDSFLLPS